MRGAGSAAAAIAASAVFAASATAAPVTRLASFDVDGSQREDSSSNPAISLDGTVVAYQTFSGDPRGGEVTQEVYAYDRETGATEWISAAPLGLPGNGLSHEPSVSADGRFVAFQSSSDDLVSGDANNRYDVFVRDRRTGQLERISDTRSGGVAHSFRPSISPGGRFVAFDSDGPGGARVLVHDRRTGANEVLRGASNGVNPSISAGGRFVAYEAGSGIAVRDRRFGFTDGISAPVGGACARIDGPGVHNPSSDPAISASGRYVAFTNDTRTTSAEQDKAPGDVFVHDRRTGRTGCVSVNGRGVRGNDLSGGAAISPNGRYVSFASNATNLVRHDTNGTRDVFLRDRQTRTTRRVSISSARNQANGLSGGGTFDGAGFPFESAISARGRFVAFPSGADNVVANDDNGRGDVFVRGPLGP